MEIFVDHEVSRKPILYYRILATVTEQLLNIIRNKVSNQQCVNASSVVTAIWRCQRHLIYITFAKFYLYIIYVYRNVVKQSLRRHEKVTRNWCGNRRVRTSIVNNSSGSLRSKIAENGVISELVIADGCY